MADERNLELQTVVEQFKQSGEALETLRERLRHIELAGDTQQQAAESIRQASESLTSLVDGIASTIEGLRSASDLATASLDAARQFLEGTDLTGLQTTVVRELAETRTALESGQSDLNQRLGTMEVKIDAELEASRSEAKALGDDRDALAAKIAALPDRVRKKHSL